MMDAPPQDPTTPDAATRLRTLIALRDTVRVELHRQLDDLLALPTKDGEEGFCIIDSIVADVANGLGVQVSVQTRHPKQDGSVPEDPSATATKSKSAIEIVR